MARSLLIQTPSDALRLLERSSRYVSISIKMPGLSESESHRWQDEFAHHYSGCGCGIGSAFSLAGVLAGGLFLYVAPRAANLWFSGGAAFAIVVGFVVIGRFAGRVRAHRRLRDAVGEFASRVATSGR